MNDTADTATQDFLASAPAKAVRANLLTFTLLSGPVLHFTDWRRPVVVGSTIYQPGPPRFVPGTIRVERGMSVSTQTVELQEANGEILQMLAQGYFRRALYTMQRCYAPNPGEFGQPAWMSPFMKFAGRMNSIDSLTASSAKLTIKSMVDDLDNEYPREVFEHDCNAVLYDVRCGLSANSYKTAGTVAAVSTKNKILSGLSNPDAWFTQGYVTFTSGPMSGISYMVKSYVGGVIVPAYPFLVAPTAGTTFNAFAGCDKTLPTCISKFGYAPSSGVAPFHRGKPFVPDPTVTY